jgi:hypothetical protein
MSKRFALYYRVSTDDQSTDPQRLELQDYCQRKGWSVAAEYCDTIPARSLRGLVLIGSWRLCAGGRLTLSFA